VTGLSILWRGPLDSCNYDCAYCPFGKTPMDRQQIEDDRRALARFVDWAVAWGAPLSIFFTPWGEALIHRHYQQALARLSRLPHVRRVAIQSNLSPRLDFLGDCEVTKVGLWSTYHPAWTTTERFAAQVAQAHSSGARVSAGAVGFPEHLPAIEALRAALPAGVYLWINAVKRLADAYTPGQLDRLRAVDPHFDLNLRPHPSRGVACRTGESVISVDGDGEARRCHFVPRILGNLYDPDFAACLRPRACPNATCRCHIGYAHMPDLGVDALFGGGLLERAPDGWWWSGAVTPGPAESAAEASRARWRWARHAAAPELPPE